MEAIYKINEEEQNRLDACKSARLDVHELIKLITDAVVKAYKRVDELTIHCFDSDGTKFVRLIADIPIADSTSDDDIVTSIIIEYEYRDNALVVDTYTAKTLVRYRKTVYNGGGVHTTNMSPLYNILHNCYTGETQNYIPELCDIVFGVSYDGCFDATKAADISSRLADVSFSSEVAEHLGSVVSWAGEVGNVYHSMNEAAKKMVKYTILELGKHPTNDKKDIVHIEATTTDLETGDEQTFVYKINHTDAKDFLLRGGGLMIKNNEFKK